MEETIYNLGDVARMLKVKPHQITYALSTGGVPEPSLRLGNRRVFTPGDVRRLAEHLHVIVSEDALVRSGASSSDVVSTEGIPVPAHDQEGVLLNTPFHVVQAGASCHEVRDGHGDLFAWAPDRARAFVVAGLLEHAVR